MKDRLSVVLLAATKKNRHRGDATSKHVTKDEKDDFTDADVHLFLSGDDHAIKEKEAF